MKPSQTAARVVLPGLGQPLFYTYDAAAGDVGVGSQVEVPVGGSTRRGWVVGFDSLEEVEKSFSASKPKKDDSDSQLTLLDAPSSIASRLKRIQSALPAFTDEQLRLFEWMADYYGASLSEVIDNAVPRVLRGRRIQAARLTARGKQSAETEIETRSKRAPVQAEVLKTLRHAETPQPIAALQHIGSSARNAVQRLVKDGLVEIIETDSTVQLAPVAEAEPHPLGGAQQAAYDQIAAALDTGAFQPFLLFGVTGSGKTEVYIHAIQETLRRGGSVLVVVPEIALTPQLVDQFESRLKTPLAVLHSQVGGSQRWEAWEALMSDQRRVAVGARSAIFAPARNLSLVIVDEEHESSYKQSDGLRYHARDIAVMRARFANCPVVLGSATPSFESLLNAKKGRYKLLEMPERVSDRPLPEIEVVDLGKVKRKDMPSENISPRLSELIEQTLATNKQVIILYNRRGFSSYLQCDSCNEVVACPDCSVAMTYHKKRNRLVCHYCDRTVDPPEFCGICRDPKTTRDESDSDKPTDRGTLHHRGGGTERVVDELQALFPEARLARMDRDTVGAKDSYRKILDSVRSGETDILVGTQMIAKGHDLPGVTLVGVIDADIGLHFPDFRSSEKVFQLITQAAGRAGRGVDPGRVAIQTRQPNHPTIVASVTNRFKAFARYELDQREALHYPPWGLLLRIIISSPTLDQAFRVAKKTRDGAREFIEREFDDAVKLEVLGPSPAPLERLRGRYRFHILVKGNSRKAISKLAAALHAFRHSITSKEVRINVDVDPVDML